MTLGILLILFNVINPLFVFFFFLINQQDFFPLFPCLNWLASLMPWNAHHAHHAMENFCSGMNNG